MQWGLVLAHILLPCAVAFTAGLGAWRCWELLRYGDDVRLRKLLWFYGLFAVSLVPMIVWTARLAAAVGGSLESGFPHNAGGLHGQFAEAGADSLLLVVHHALMIASLAVAVQAFTPSRPPLVAVAALAFIEHTVWVALAIEALLTLYLAAQALRNHRSRRSPGALHVAIGFGLFFLGHLSILILHQPGGARTPLGDLITLVGLVVLVRLLPRPTA